jgi:hypothetical protein
MNIVAACNRVISQRNKARALRAFLLIPAAQNCLIFNEVSQKKCQFCAAGFCGVRVADAAKRLRKL